MDLIIQQSNHFRNKVINYFKKTYKLSECKIAGDLKSSKFILFKNNIILHNSIINKHYNLDLSNNNYTIIHILYKNLNINGDFCYSDSSIKNNCLSCYNTFKKSIPLSNQIQIIGRKYKDKDGSIFENSLNKYTFINKASFTNKTSKITQKTKCIIEEEIPNINVKHKFINNLKDAFIQSNIKFSETSLNNAFYLDTEYTTDIYDNLEEFPISKDTSILFMIGVFHKNRYINFTTNKLDSICEKSIVKNFIDYLKEHSINNTSLIFHWSNAEKYIFNKMKKKYPELFENINIVFIDLYNITKESIKLQKYSLKYTLSKLLNLNYDTDCKNGADAMMAIIKNNMLLQSKTTSQGKTSLLDFDNTKDIIQYNKLDTESLYKLLRFFQNFS